MLNAKTGLKIAFSLFFAMLLLSGITACEKSKNLSNKAHEMFDKASDKLNDTGEAMEDIKDNLKKKAKEAKDSM